MGERAGIQFADARAASRTHATPLPTQRRASLPGGAPALALALQRSAGNRAVSRSLGGSANTTGLRTFSPAPLPGGSQTRALPLPSLAPSGGTGDRSTASGAPSATGETLPASLAAVMPGLGADLLRAALDPGPAPRRVDPPVLDDGEPLDPSTRAPYERALGYDLSPVRVHRGAAADQAALATRSVAFSLGDHIVLSRSLDLGSTAGRHVLGHELVHTVQGRLGGGGGGRISEPWWPSETEAERGAAAMAAGERYRVGVPAGPDVHRIAPWLILAGIGLAAGLIIWAASDSPEENRRRHEAGAPNAATEVWALVPIYGSIQQIREADSYFQRVLGVGFLMLDCATIGTAGIAAKALIKAPSALIRTAIARRGAALAVREGGEIASEAMAKETAATFGREGGALLASQAQASNEMLAALQRGGMVVVTEGGLNHAAIYARNAAGQVVKLHGGPLRVLFAATGREISEEGTKSVARKVNAYLIIEAGETSVSIEQAVAQVSKSGPAALRWIGGNPTSCGIMQGALLEASGLSAETTAKLLPAGGAAGRMLPISILGQMAGSGGLRFVEGGMTRIVGGTLLQGSLLGTGAAIGPMASTMMRFTVATLGEEGPTDEAVAAEKAAAPDQRSRESDDAALAIVSRFGVAPTGPRTTITNQIGDVVPGWFVRSLDFHAAVAKSLVHLGMDAAIAREITGT